MKRILALSSIRSDYDLMSGVYNLLASDPEINFKVLVSGAHLSRNYGLTVKHIDQDDLKVLAKIETLIDGDSRSSRLKTASILLQCSIDIVAGWAPDIILYAGDREDVLIGGMLGVYLGIPTVHFFGGDHEKDGHSDTLIRHAASKLSTAHVVSIQEHRERLIAMGENPNRIFVSGSVALDKFIAHKTAPARLLPEIIPNSERFKDYVLVIFHPVDGEAREASEQFENILQVLAMKGIPACVSYPNTDPGNHGIINIINNHAGNIDFWFYKNLCREDFMTIYRNARFLIGNSSSGILEAASIPIGVINVGTRQKGRYCSDNVIFCDSSRASISAAIEQVLSKDFTKIVNNTINPYGTGDSCNRVYSYLKHTDFRKLIPKMEDPLDLRCLSENRDEGQDKYESGN